MQFVCDASPKTWFRIETEAEAGFESKAMSHAVEKYFKQAYQQAADSYVPPKAGQSDKTFRPIIVGPDNTDPYPEHGEAIKKLAAHFKLSLDPARCYPYRR